MKKIIGLVVLSLFAISASAADLMASSTAPTVTQNIVVEGAACPGVGATGFSSTGLLLSCQSGRWSVVGGTLDCHTRYVARWTPANINNLEYGSANWCSAGYRMVGWDTRGADGRAVSGGEGGNINSWAFCCRMQ